jgi:hypothetical protein
VRNCKQGSQNTRKLSTQNHFLGDVTSDVMRFGDYYILDTKTSLGII